MNNGLLDALKEIGWPDLPPAIDGKYKKKWIKAVARVRKSNGQISFCLVVNDGKDYPRIVRDFGPVAIICEILSIHPYEATTSNIVPRFVSDEQRLKYLRKMGYNEADIKELLSTDNKSPEQVEADRKQINEYIEEVAMRQAKMMSDINEDARKRIEMADPELKEKNAKRKKYGKTATGKTSGGKK